MPLDYTNPSVIKFFKENYDKEKEKRVLWFLANKENLIKQATLTEKHKGYVVDDIQKASLEIFMPIVTVHHKVSAVNRRKKVPIDGLILGIPKERIDSNNQLLLSPNPLMKPVESVVSSILYDKSLGGARQYLNVRKRKIPDEKYYFCETSANVIGWQWKDSAFPRRLPKFGRHAILLHEASRSGPQPDLKHYMKLVEGNEKSFK